MHRATVCARQDVGAFFVATKEKYGNNSITTVMDSIILPSVHQQGHLEI